MIPSIKERVALLTALGVRLLDSSLAPRTGKAPATKQRAPYSPRKATAALPRPGEAIATIRVPKVIPMTTVTLAPPQSLDPALLARIERLVQTPGAAALVAEAEAARAQKRTAILRDYQIRKAAADQEQEVAVSAARPIEAEVARLRGELRAAEARLGQAQYRQFLAEHAVERLGNRVVWDLHEFGGEAIEHAVHAVGLAWRQALSNVGLRQVPAPSRPFGAPAHFVDTLDERTAAEAENLRRLMREIEALRLADLEPREIEKRCADACELAENPRLWLKREKGKPRGRWTRRG